MEPIHHIEPLRLVALIFYGFTGSVSTALLYLYAFTWRWHRRKAERLAMVIKCVGFIVFSIGVVWGNWSKLEEPITTASFWVVMLGIAIVDAGWLLKAQVVLNYIKDYKPEVALL